MIPPVFPVHKLDFSLTRLTGLAGFHEENTSNLGCGETFVCCVRIPLGTFTPEDFGGLELDGWLGGDLVGGFI